MKDTKIYNQLKEYGLLPTDEGWNDLDDVFKEAYREVEAVFDTMTDEEMIEQDEKLLSLFNELHELEENTDSDEEEESAENNSEKVIFENKDVSFGFTPEEKLTVNHEKEEKDDEVTDRYGVNYITSIKGGNNLNNSETENTTETETETSEENNSENENDMKKQKTEVETPIEKEEKPKLITETVEETTETTITENAEEPTEKNIENNGSVEVSSQTPPIQQTEDYAEFIQFLQDKETVSAKDFRTFNIPEEIWRRGKVEIRLGNLRIYKTAPSLMFNKWVVEKIN